MQKNLPKRKNLRLKQHDYSSAGAYFITICTRERKAILSDILIPVGVGAHDDPQIRYTPVGKIVEKHLLSSEKIGGVRIDSFVIMPDHIHVIIVLNPEENINEKCGSSRAPTPTNEMIPHIISTFKRLCAKEVGSNIFQRGYMEHIIRDRKDYETRRSYIYQNPIKRYYGTSDE